MLPKLDGPVLEFAVAAALDEAHDPAEHRIDVSLIIVQRNHPGTGVIPDLVVLDFGNRHIESLTNARAVAPALPYECTARPSRGSGGSRSSGGLPVATVARVGEEKTCSGMVPAHYPDVKKLSSSLQSRMSATRINLINMPGRNRIDQNDLSL